MEFIQFCEEVRKGVEKIYKEKNEKNQVRLEAVQKNNGVTLRGITVFENDTNISPTVYVEGAYQSYLNGRSIENVVEEICEIYENHKVEEGVDLDFYQNFDCVRKGIVYKLVHYEMNKEMLENVPHMKYLDLAVVFYYLISQNETGNSCVVIRKEHLKMWNVSVEDVFKEAAKNTPVRLKAQIQPIEQILLSRIEQTKSMDKLDFETAQTVHYLRECLENGESKMFVLSNQDNFNGACCLLYRNVLKSFADKMHQNLFVLPSSIHEVILVPVNEFDQPNYFEDMVKEINATQVEREEVLSNHVYYYDRESDEMTFCA